MAILKIVKKKSNEEFLRKKSREVTEITPRIQTLIDDMVETMRAANGCGLAAVQIGVLRRIVVIETEEGLFELVNPVIISSSGEQEGVEGCLSIPNEWGLTQRPETVTVRALDRNGKTFKVTGSGLLAKAFCHEIDHLDGKLYTDNVIRMLDRDEIE